MITIFTITYNEEIMIKFFIDHYRKLFPNCNIIIHDNESTDNTISIAKNLSCEVHSYDTNNTLSDSMFLTIKNNCWKNSNNNWNVVCDCDELIEITQEQLEAEESLGTNIISFTGYSMINNSNLINLNDIKYGYRESYYDKHYLFNKQYIKDINYDYGCHKSNPVAIDGQSIKYSINKYRALHYKFLSPQYTINRYRLFSSRLSDENIRNNWSYHYKETEKNIIDHYNTKWENKIKIFD